ncbi:hypothetical protein [Nocardioides sp.]|uniref:hypothetical protein n=1 Tax=Nocardioides sp. TaxID=35761 RepID=UPI00262C371F|nr:hypothetical protein [Nocardioides sp.]MDI6911509.1 hypothetical protein [Nocardioides sp.]
MDDPASPPVPAGSAPRARVDPTFAWTAATLPLAYVPIAYFAPAAAVATGGVLALAAAVSCVLDHRRVRAAVDGSGRDFPPVSVLIPFLYLVLRTIRIKSTPAIPVVGVAAIGLVILGQLTFAQIVQFQGDSIEADIAKWAREQGATSAHVECPNKMIRADQEVTCIVSAGGQQAPVTVKIGDDGYYWWNWA